MIIPHRQLSADALAGVIEEYVTRDGTELSDADAKRVSVLAALDRGDLVLVFDTESESCNILPVDALTADGDLRSEPDGAVDADPAEYVDYSEDDHA